jgi:hypothetical protein
MKKPSLEFQEYSRKVHPARIEFMQSRGIQYFMEQSHPKKLHQFLIMWTGLSIKMTEQVENWIKGAGEKTKVVGQEEVGDLLVRHSEQEADHDQMLVKDLDFLVKKWNEIYEDSLRPEDITNLATPEFTKAYVDLHEEAINGQQPYRQVAIEFEIERISVHYGPRMIENVLNILGYEFEEGLSFLVDHVMLDQGHTKFNTHLLERCIATGGEVNALADTGSRAMRTYAGFLNECINLTQKVFESQTWKSQITI